MQRRNMDDVVVIFNSEEDLNCVLQRGDMEFRNLSCKWKLLKKKAKTGESAAANSAPAPAKKSAKEELAQMQAMMGFGGFGGR